MTGLRLMHDGFPLCPDFIPWDAITDDNRHRAERNHGQTVERLNERGGVSPMEFRAIALDRGWNELYGHGSRGNGIGFEQYYDAVNFVRNYLEMGPLPDPRDDVFSEWRRKNRL